MAGARGVGEFWAYFPTSIQTTLSGIVNAPWKLSADRLAMVPGAYNQELLISGAPTTRGIRDDETRSPEDPGASRSAPGPRTGVAVVGGDGLVNGPIFAALARRPCLPDQRRSAFAEGTQTAPARVTAGVEGRVVDAASERMDTPFG